MDRLHIWVRPVGQVVVDVDVGQQQRGDPLADPGPAVARQQRHGGDDRHDVDGDQAQGTLPEVVRVDGGGSPARCRAIQGRDSRKPDSTKNTATPTSSRDSAVPRPGVRRPRPRRRRAWRGRRRPPPPGGSRVRGRRPRIPDGLGGAWGRVSHAPAGAALLFAHAAAETRPRRAVPRGVRGPRARCPRGRRHLRPVGRRVDHRTSGPGSRARFVRVGRRPVALLRAQLPLHVAQRACRRGRPGPRPPRAPSGGERAGGRQRAGPLRRRSSTRSSTSTSRRRACSTRTSPTSTSAGASTWCWRSRRWSTSGLDEDVRDDDKPLRALERLRAHVAPGGRLWVTHPVGYNPALDARLRDGVPGVTRMRALRRERARNRVARGPAGAGLGDVVRPPPLHRPRGRRGRARRAGRRSCASLVPTR